jgi:hypothetical protein
VSTKAIHLYQTRAYMNAREIGLTQANAAYIAEISERTGQRIEAGQHQPNRGKVADRNSTQDPLGNVWDKELEPMLKKEPIYLRGSNDFGSIEEYRLLVDAAVAKLNQQCQQKFDQEREHLQPLPKYRVPDYEILTACVSNRSTVEVRCVLYTVPSRLIGRQLELHLYHDRIVGYLGNHQVVELPRIRVTDSDKRRGRCINYRHVIEGLRRKPRAFIYCTWQQDLLPTAQFRELWTVLTAQFDLDTAAELIVEALYLAATQDQEAAVADYLAQELKGQTLTLKRLQQHFRRDVPESFPQLTIEQHDLASYDRLLDSNATERIDSPEYCPEPLSAPLAPPQTTPTVPHARSLGVCRTPSYAGAMVLCQILTHIMRTGNQSSQRSPAPVSYTHLTLPTT